ncbi:MAG: 1-acyl-sn-glycerol-3-phosphate acyltransferase [Pseudonocardiaceae bacterium]|nr:1-acyl-sn-glycerol-3-phosphate acyltransferase [Pseudonocardiaceae bacterium]
MTDELPEAAWPLLHDAGRSVAVGLGAAAFRLRVHGRERIPARGPVVLVANHSAMIDGPLLYGLLRRRSVFLVKHEMFHGLLGWFLTRIGQLSVRRGVPDRAPLLAAVAVLRGGGIVAVFPEGTRGEGDVASAHHGAAWLARSSGAVMLPVACRGTRRPGGSGRRWRPRVDVLVGEPLDAPVDKGRAALTAATDRMRSALSALVDELDSRRGMVR